MKNLSLHTTLLLLCLFTLFTITPSCTLEQGATPITSGREANITARTDFSGLEEQVKIKIAERDQISVSQILTCYYDGTTPEGYGLYRYTTATYSGIYIVTSIIGEEIDG